MMGKLFLLLLFCISAHGLFSQGSYAGPVGTPSSIAIHKDSSIIHSWVTACELKRGFKDINDTSLGRTSVGTAQMTLGMAMANGVVSLGDSGMATLTFNGSLYNGIGPDFAVFENGFGDAFLELAFVEVSSDGLNFFRFPSISDTDTSQQVPSYGTLNTSYIHNLAGKYPIGYGTPFDLDDLKNVQGLNINNISHVRVVDVIGSMADSLASLDSRGVKVNDPYPTAWPNGGFDLDAVAAIHINPTGLRELVESRLRLYPNPVSRVLYIDEVEFLEYRLYNPNGKLLKTGVDNSVDVERLSSGIYLIQIITEVGVITKKIAKQ